MRTLRIGVVGGLLVALLAAASAQANDLDAPAMMPCAPATREDVDIPEGNATVPTRTVRVLYPTCYDPSGATTYPVVFLLHGAGDGYETWVENTDVETFAPGLGVIVVMPDAGGKHSEAGWYTDWNDGPDWESFHTGDLVEWVQQNLPVRAAPAHWAVMGLSMGGFGALSYAARHPDLFSAAASFSGLLDTQIAAPASGVGFSLAHDQFGSPDERVWGDQFTDADTWAEHNPTALARAGRFDHLEGKLWLTTGTGTPGGPAGDDPSNPGGYALEQFIWDTNQSFKLAANRAETPYQDRSYLGGPHDWAHWQWALHQVLPDVVDAIQGD